jgi:MoxR-like ATPase
MAQVVLADEINRATPKTQSALLESMEERQATVDGVTYPLPQPFIVLATQNPIEYEGTYPLPEAQIDRFLVRIAIGYPSRPQEKEIMERRRQRKRDEADVAQVASGKQLREMQAAVEEVHVADDLEHYMVEIVHRTREHSLVEVGASPRGSLAILKLTRARAALEGRDYVIPDDVKAVAVPALAHRLILKPDPWVKGVKTTAVVEDILAHVPVPKVS